MYYYKFCKFVAIRFLHSHKASVRANSNLYEKHQINPTQDISSLKSFRPLFNPVLTAAPSDAKNTSQENLCWQHEALQ